MLELRVAKLGGLGFGGGVVFPNEGLFPADGPKFKLGGGVAAFEVLVGIEAGTATFEDLTDDKAEALVAAADPTGVTGGCFGATLALPPFLGLLLLFNFSLLEFVEELVDSSIEAFFEIGFEGVTSLLAAPGGLEGFLVLA